MTIPAGFYYDGRTANVSYDPIFRAPPGAPIIRLVAAPRRRRSGNRAGRGLVALGSAAVLAVYTAGYARTRAAAERLEAETARPRPVVPAPAPTPVASMASAAPAPAPTVVPLQPAATPAAARPAEPRRTPRVTATPSPVATPAGSTAVTPAASPVATVSSPPAATPASTPAATAIAPAPATPVSEPSPAPTVAASPRLPAGMYKDGTFSGRGHSRHGDIEAAITIEDGRIVYAAITVCATRYPCDMIDKLPAQVIARQSPEVDFIAGATDSTNAFYYAIVAALERAK